MVAQIFNPPTMLCPFSWTLFRLLSPMIISMPSIMPIIIRSTFDIPRKVWDDAFLRKVVIGWMATMGTNMILQDDLECRVVIGLHIILSHLHHYP